ncbi:hypothetical protein [Flavobacterium sp. ACAM 123]|jgi:hypothetical protein|uniref:hypothetical protein n=1 Tax=Flavobacterium sp. ACAM 123 TaxID=1189620 RepID=UPI0002FF56E8|nr:hypothetical protein [Flavobacterium sp. ACAM 123]
MSTDLSSPFNAEVIVDQNLDGCETSTIRWTSAESDGEGGMILTFHKATLVTCDDGFAAIVP